ncbi:MAG: hypothetical protein K0R51_1094 [Cytophagaceae bacterium]|nr:hypothetical protein [Cytophagaceae bacterium]
MFTNYVIAQKSNHIIKESKLKVESFIRNDKKDSALALIKDMGTQCKETCDYIHVINYLYGYYYDYSGDILKAEKYYSKSLATKANDTEVLDRRGLVYYSLQRYTQSETDFRKSIAYNKESSFPYYMLSLVYTVEPYHKNSDSANFYIDKALKLDSLNIDYLNQKVIVLLSQQKCFEASPYESKILGLLNKPTETDILQAVDILTCMQSEKAAINMLLNFNSREDSEKIWAKLAKIYSSQKDWKSTIYWLEKIADKYSSIDAMVDLVRVKYQIGEMDEAKTNLDQFINVTNGHPGLYELKSDIYRAESDLKTALIYINKAVEKSDHLNFLNKKARLEAESLDYKSAFMDYSKILKVDSCNIEVLVFCSKYDLMNANFKNAIRLAEKAQQCGYKLEIIDVLVQSYFYNGQYDQVISNIDKWWANDKANESCIFIKAVMEACYGDKDKAIVLCKMLQNNISAKNAEANKILLSLLYLISGDMKSFYSQMDQITSLDKQVFEKFVLFEKKKNKDDLEKIRISKRDNFEFLLTIVISEEQLNEIKRRYNID